MTLLRRIFSVPPLTTKPGATIVGAGAAGAAVGAAPTGASAGFFVGGAAGAAVGAAPTGAAAGFFVGGAAALFDTAAARRSLRAPYKYASSSDDESVADDT